MLKAVGWCQHSIALEKLFFFSVQKYLLFQLGERGKYENIQH
jgi:hypothetical protein